MQVAKEYIVKLENINTSSLVISFNFRTIIEVKNFLKHIGQTLVVSDGAYSCKLYERIVNWDLSDGTFYDYITQITEDL